ncbi:uncharacterized protein AB675_5404 [Cyphellophora attinorum]|uniref:Uncharacterized protein n=1 Tax=Cyphellophora attinorum TaxID=1664694 RepID=A0A0N1HCC9_9EURO|nr:uncharacterized protein AB675_5404 [Phialophora attinorum]KPI41953.1 hypothetical protein AB675_5404 [Phialophora attinorum]
MSITIDDQTSTAEDLSTEEMELLIFAKKMHDRKPSVSHAIRVAMAIIRKTQIRHKIRSGATAIIFQGMADHQEDTCLEMDEHVNLVLEYNKTLIKPENGMEDSLRRADEMREGLRLAELVGASFRAARGVLTKCPAAVGIEILRSPGTHVHDARCGYGRAHGSGNGNGGGHDPSHGTGSGGSHGDGDGDGPASPASTEGTLS